MTMYIRVGNQTVTAAQLNSLTPTDVKKINEDATRAENMRQNNLAESMGLRKAPNTINLSAPDVRPGSELAKALVEDLLAKKAAEAALLAPVEEVKKSTGKKRGRKPKIKTEIILVPEKTQIGPSVLPS